MPTAPFPFHSWMTASEPGPRRLLRAALTSAVGLVMVGLGSCGLPLADWVVLPVYNRKGQDVDLARIRIDLDKLHMRVGGDPATYAFYGEGREPLPYALVPEQAPVFAELRLPLPAAGLRLTIVCPGPRSTEPLADGPVSRWPARVQFERATR